LLASLVNLNKLGSPKVSREEVMETRWWNNNSGADWIPLALTQLGQASYTDLKSCLITRGFESEVIEFLHSYKPHSEAKEVWTPVYCVKSLRKHLDRRKKLKKCSEPPAMHHTGTKAESQVTLKR
jgi:hypothetical protein